MSETTNLTIRIDKKLKKDCEKLYKELGMNMTTAITTFLKQSIIRQGLPYPISKDIPNDETKAALNDAIDKPLDGKTYSSFEDFQKDMRKEYEKYIKSASNKKK